MNRRAVAWPSAAAAPVALIAGCFAVLLDQLGDVTRIAHRYAKDKS
ncbi:MULTISPECIES: hypothetical protein [Rhodococcus]|nr:MULTISPECIES: hypothetical protein [Rhodococcus]